VSVPFGATDALRSRSAHPTPTARLGNAVGSSPLGPGAIARGEAGPRILPSFRKLLQRAFLNVLDPLGERIFHPASFGFRGQCTLDMALVRTRERKTWGQV